MVGRGKEKNIRKKKRNGQNGSQGEKEEKEWEEKVKQREEMQVR